MPRIKSAKKALRVSAKKRLRNLETQKKYKLVLNKYAKATKEDERARLLQESFSTLDKAAKKNVITKNKAARLKSKISKKFKLVLEDKPIKKAPGKKNVLRKKSKK